MQRVKNYTVCFRRRIVDQYAFAGLSVTLTLERVTFKILYDHYALYLF